MQGIDPHTVLAFAAVISVFHVLIQLAVAPVKANQKRFEARLDKLEARLDALETRMDKNTAEIKANQKRLEEQQKQVAEQLSLLLAKNGVTVTEAPQTKSSS